MTRRYPNTPPPGPRLAKSVKRLHEARQTLAELGEPYYGGSVIGGSRNSHADSGRHPDPKGAIWRSKVVYADQLVNDLAHRLERMASDEARPKAWQCSCGYSRFQPYTVRFCAKCGRARPDPPDPQSNNASPHSEGGTVGPQEKATSNA